MATSSVNIVSEVSNFGIENIFVTLTWREEIGASYNVTVVPQVVMNFTGQAAVQLMVSYNIIYNVTVLIIVCGQTIAMTMTKVKYGQSR